MKQIEFEVAAKRYKCSLPENWDELTVEQFRHYVEVGEVNAELVRRIAVIPDVVTVSLQPADWWYLTEQLRWMEEVENLRRLYIEELKLKDGTVFYGYNSDFSDVTWEEWAFADSYASAKRWNVVAAVLYRQERAGWDHESDRRVPFTKYGTEQRMELFAGLDELTLRTVSVNYLLLRKRLTDHYPHLFYEAIEEEEENGKRKATQKPRADWLRLIRSMMGDNFYEEQKYLQLSVPSVLYQLEQRVKESNKHGK